jgi:hypothetical protein
MLIDGDARVRPDLPGADSERIQVVRRSPRRVLAKLDERLSGLAGITTDTK